ncbi:hypothetical protein [Chryseobacterium sp. 8AT]|uniref:hypothetical protein n=1 Tax=Chryseobacterium sp. 8AT TaxID=2653134 RepID=UPI0012F041EC|nr:hypothetical protein [Chryseobacterium sp. 8AT]VXB03948.1 conserved hypothetical protein [Chryseobacterium sp. 8AT]
MPKSEIGEVYCINKHASNNPMTKADHPAVMSSLVKEEGREKPSIILGRGYVFEIYSCEECGYNELYDFVDTEGLLKD